LALVASPYTIEVGTFSSGLARAVEGMARVSVSATTRSVFTVLL
jgi:hypothetical protein